MSVKNLIQSIKKIFKIKNDKRTPKYGFSSLSEWIDFKKKYIPYVVIVILLIGVIVTQSEVQRVKEIRSRAVDVTPSQTKNFDPIGSFDELSCSEGFSGWACDPDNYSQAVSVDVYVDGTPGTGQFVMRMNATLAQSTNAAAFCGGSVNHRFKTKLPDYLADGKTHAYYLYADNVPVSQNKSHLMNSPKTITCY